MPICEGNQPVIQLEGIFLLIYVCCTHVYLRIDEGIEKDAELYSVPPSLMQEIRNSPLLEDYFKKFVKQPKVGRKFQPKKVPQPNVTSQVSSFCFVIVVSEKTSFVERKLERTRCCSD